MRPKRPTQRQRAVAAWIHEYIRAHNGIAPLQIEIAHACGFQDTARVRMMLRRLEARGLIARGPRRSRNLHIPVENPKLSTLRIASTSPARLRADER